MNDIYGEPKYVCTGNIALLRMNIARRVNGVWFIRDPLIDHRIIETNMNVWDEIRVKPVEFHES